MSAVDMEVRWYGNEIPVSISDEVIYDLAEDIKQEHDDYVHIDDEEMKGVVIFTPVLRYHVAPRRPDLSPMYQQFLTVEPNFSSDLAEIYWVDGEKEREIGRKVAETFGLEDDFKQYLED